MSLSSIGELFLKLFLNTVLFITGADTNCFKFKVYFVVNVLFRCGIVYQVTTVWKSSKIQSYKIEDIVDFVWCWTVPGPASSQAREGLAGETCVCRRRGNIRVLSERSGTNPTHTTSFPGPFFKMRRREKALAPAGLLCILIGQWQVHYYAILDKFIHTLG